MVCVCVCVSCHMLKEYIDAVETQSNDYLAQPKAIQTHKSSPAQASVGGLKYFLVES